MEKLNDEPLQEDQLVNSELENFEQARQDDNMEKVFGRYFDSGKSIMSGRVKIKSSINGL